MSKPIIQLNEESVKSELKELVRNSVEETLNELLNKEAEELPSAQNGMANRTNLLPVIILPSQPMVRLFLQQAVEVECPVTI